VQIALMQGIGYMTSKYRPFLRVLLRKPWLEGGSGCSQQLSISFCCIRGCNSDRKFKSSKTWLEYSLSAKSCVRRLRVGRVQLDMTAEHEYAAHLQRANVPKNELWRLTDVCLQADF
jgi:hypothetical protein